MTIIGDFQNGVSEALNFGQLVRLKYYDVGYGAGSYYDDDITLTQSGNDYWTSGVILPISNTRGSSDAVLLEQGKIIMDDTKLYLSGSVGTSGVIKYGLGSPPSDEYKLISEGTMRWNVNEYPILKKIYLRRLTNGSLLGE